ncbi:ATP-binding protein [Corynebacterium sp. HMSC29G08]|uniref:ATP-binding protein n=1 Tax=Corynebacterium sp. HMSC29G08 TaxID=1581069 RepID=UPI001FEFC45F|nr:ATP-binding protein [Corynebacterium sp. HMSC29G08]
MGCVDDGHARCAAELGVDVGGGNHSVAGVVPDFAGVDDFLTTPIDAATAHQLLNILAEREHRGSTIVTSQFTPDKWYKSIPDAVIAESILNRLVVGAEIITLERPNMRLEANTQ